MLKARLDDLLIFGLSDKNLELLKQGRPIMLPVTEGLNTQPILLFYGADEYAMVTNLKQMGMKFTPEQELEARDCE